jgi:hypothetical protein
MAVLLAALSVAPWAHPLAFATVPGWQTGASGTTRSHYTGTRYAWARQSSAWTASGVRYLDGATADPPNRTLAHLPARAVVVWAVIFTPAASEPAPIRLDLGRATRFDCCEAAPVAGGVYVLTGAGPAGGAYTVIVRAYFGSRPTVATRAAAQRALDRLELPASR